MFSKTPLYLIFLCALAFAQFTDMPLTASEDNRVSSISIDGAIYTNTTTLKSRIPLRENSSYSPSVLAEQVKKSIESLYETGMFDNIKVLAKYGEGGAVHLIFEVTEQPALDTLLIEGNDDVSKDELRLKTRMTAGAVYSKSDLERDRQAILSYYRSQGYLLAEAWVEEIPVGEHKNKVIIHISEGNKVKVDSISISGNHGVPREEIIRRMQTKRDSWWGGGDFKLDVFEADRDSVINAARRHGFLDAELLEYEAIYLPDSSCRFYLGRMARRGSSLQLLYHQLNKNISDKENPLHSLTGKSIAMASHYYREHRSQMGIHQAFPVPNIQNEKQAAEVLNNIITYGAIRKEWIKSLRGKAWKDPRIDSLLAIKKRTVYEEKLLVRYSLEETIPALMQYDSVNTASYVHINIDIKEGRKYYAGRVHFTGNEVLPTAFLQAQVRLDSGKVFNHDQYDSTKRAILSAYREDGYLFVQIDETRIFVNDSVVNLTFALREGLPAQIHKVHIRGNTKTKDKVIRREIRLFPGDTYRQSLLERSFRDIMQLNYFDSVMPDVQPVGEQDVDLLFAVSEREAGTGQFGAGAAYSQADGLVFTLNLSIPNCCMGDGQALNVSGEYGTDKRSVSAGFSEPWLFDTPTRIGASLNYSWWNGYNAHDITRYGGNVFLGRRLTWPDDYFYVQGGIGWQRNKQGANPEFPDGSPSLVRFTGDETSLDFVIIRDDKNLPIFPTEGSRYMLSSSWAVPDFLGGDFSFLQTELSIKWWFPILPDKLTLGITNEFGVITGDVLQYRRLYQMGGALGYKGLMRGYRPGSLGAYRLGRSYQYFGAELTWPISQNLFYLIPIFFDAGNVFGDVYDWNEPVSRDIGSPLREWDISSLKRDFGFGFRILVPMLGIIGFDFAWPLDPGEHRGFDVPGIGTMEFNFIISQGF
ncbi:MAG: BamA/TamA family outer membrane protein [Fibromonadaceae bacterium]|jgi:outer membrane protein insertion porin family|nr:BamA/TamA family outer membrane protein [Fibromonadaceae bacterium]